MLNPFAEQFDLPASFVNVSHAAGGQFKMSAFGEFMLSMTATLMCVAGMSIEKAVIPPGAFAVAGAASPEGAFSHRTPLAPNRPNGSAGHALARAVSCSLIESQAWALLPRLPAISCQPDSPVHFAIIKTDYFMNYVKYGAFSILYGE